MRMLAAALSFSISILSFAPAGAAEAGPGPWHVTRNIRPIDDLGSFLGIESWSGGYTLPAGRRAARLSVELYRDGEPLPVPDHLTSYVTLEGASRQGQWAMLMARGDALPLIGDADLTRMKLALTCGDNDTGNEGMVLSREYGARGGAKWEGSLDAGPQAPDRVLLHYQWYAPKGTDLDPKPKTLEELRRRTSRGDLMLVWLQAR